MFVLNGRFGKKPSPLWCDLSIFYPVKVFVQWSRAPYLNSFIIMWPVPVSFRPLSHRPRIFAVAECVCAAVYETGMTVSGVREDHSVLLASGPSLVAVWRAVFEFT